MNERRELLVLIGVIAVVMTVMTALVMLFHLEQRHNERVIRMEIPADCWLKGQAIRAANPRRRTKPGLSLEAVERIDRAAFPKGSVWDWARDITLATLIGAVIGLILALTFHVQRPTDWQGWDVPTVPGPLDSEVDR